MPIRAIILDAGGVILHERDHAERAKWETRLGLAQGQLTHLVFDSEPAAHAASGAILEPQVWQAIGSHLALSAGQVLELQRDFWASEQLDEPFVQFIQGLRPRYRIGILSNAWSDARAFHNAKFGFNTWVDSSVYSAEVKLLKPDPRIYQLICTQLELSAAECLFVDDKLENVQAAQALGMAGVQYLNTTQTIHDVTACLAASIARSDRTHAQHV